MNPEIIRLRHKQGPMRPAELPLSKSIALRVLTLNAVSKRLGHGKADIRRLPDAGDVAGMLRALRLYDEAGLTSRHIVNIGEGGAPFRFFTALAASTPGLDMTVAAGRPLMRRPHAILLEALRAAGADVRGLRSPDRPPLHIRGRRLSPAVVEMDPGVSSQYVSALMMAAPLWEYGLTMPFHSEGAVSLPYLEMTARIMERFGAGCRIAGGTIRVEPGKCAAPERYDIETDWSAASYFYELALLTPGAEVPLASLTPPGESLQGDAACAGIFARLGVATNMAPDGSAILRCDPERLNAVTASGETYGLDLGGTPDLAPALAVAFCLAGVRFRFSGVAHLRHKETDRMAALCAELAKLGYVLEPGAETLEWSGCRTAPQRDLTIATYSDHRMAMAFAPAAVRFPDGISIESPEVVGKSYPRYWENLEGLGFELIDS